MPAVFVPGGHDPMMDLLDDPDAGTVMRHFHKTSKPTAVLCHGPISLLSALPNSTEVVTALAAGGDVSVLAPWKSYVLQDRELISGQNPFSDEALLNLLLPALNEKNSASGLQKGFKDGQSGSNVGARRAG